MAYHIATIQVLIDVEDQGQACDAMSETIRPLLREFAGADSCWIDWRYIGGNRADGSSVPVPHDGSGFEYATPQERTPQEIAAQFGCYIGHDIGGWYIADESEREKDERGTSVGFDGRPHYETEQAAANALQEAKEPQALLKAD